MSSRVPMSIRECVFAAEDDEPSDIGRRTARLVELLELNGHDPSRYADPRNDPAPRDRFERCPFCGGDRLNPQWLRRAAPIRCDHVFHQEALP